MFCKKCSIESSHSNNNYSCRKHTLISDNKCKYCNLIGENCRHEWTNHEWTNPLDRLITRHWSCFAKIKPN